ncbi:hypothetical protein [Pyruvatibacter mobilis]|uniref:hypothetical protein n=1 Tax=Pyruvatibacter mobilis TaxID=1712261 RepID=UPI003BAA585B
MPRQETRTRQIAAALPVLVVAAHMAASCTTVTIHDSAGGTRVSSHFGIVDIAPAAEGQGRVVEVESIGMAFAEKDFVLGYHAASYAQLPTDDCRVIAWIENADDLAALEQQAADLPGICSRSQMTTAETTQDLTANQEN